ncbi:hypothetical protein GCM10009592_05230 [Brachybacterium rhamnosum]
MCSRRRDGSYGGGGCGNGGKEAPCEVTRARSLDCERLSDPASGRPHGLRAPHHRPAAPGMSARRRRMVSIGELDRAEVWVPIRRGVGTAQ